MHAQRLRLFGIALIILFGLCLLSVQPAHAADPALRGWTDTGITVAGLLSPNNTRTGIIGTSCFDTRDPDIFYYSVNITVSHTPPFSDTYTADWKAGQQQRLNAQSFDQCGADGALYLQGYTPDPGKRITKTNPQGDPLAHYPTHVAQDGTHVVYSLEGDASLIDETVGHLFYSPDNGTTWQDRTPVGITGLRSLAVTPSDSRVIYLFTAGVTEPTHNTPYTLYASRNAGLSWQKRASGTISISYYGSFNVRILTPENIILLEVVSPGAKDVSKYYYLSQDGNNFVVQPESTDSRFERGFASYVAYYGTADGIVRVKQEMYEERGISRTQYVLSLSLDGGVTWNTYATLDSLPTLYVSPAAPANVFMTHADPKYALSYSSDSGKSWQDIAAQPDQLFISPYLPLTVLGVFGNRLYSLDLPDAGKRQTQPVPVKSTPDSIYFPQTQHTMSPLFSQYWTDHGGLAQFGYPKTEAFRELNPADNHIYVVQYFERARFEYHPEAPPTYRVLLGLLGNQLTAARSAAGEGAFNRFQDQHYPGGAYFPQTGHNLRNDFKKYWDARGGLAIYGYPTSEEFYEVNPDNGKTYVVQYFERNRFEYHPENTGTPYVVLLGLLGNQVLRDKHWL